MSTIAEDVLKNSEEKKLNGAAVVKRPPVAMDARGVRLQSMDDLARFATMYFESNLAPSCFQSPQAVAVAMQTGMEAGLSPAAAVRSLIVIEKSKEPMWRGQAALGLIRNSKACELFTIGNPQGTGDERSVTIRAKRFDMPTPVEVSFAVAEARKAGLLSKNNWQNWQDDMLVWRCTSRTAKRYFSDILMGLEIAEAREHEPIDIRPTIPPQEPDPLLTAVAEDLGAKKNVLVEPHEDLANIWKDAQDGAAPTLEDQLLASLVDKLEGKIVSAENGKQLEKVWKDAQEPIVTKVSGSERHRLTKLYQQNLTNFKGEK